MVFPLDLLLLLLEGALLSLLKRDRRFIAQIYWPVFTALAKQWRQLWRLRRKIQQGRRVSSRQFLLVFQWMPHKLTALIKYGLPDVR